MINKITCPQRLLGFEKPFHVGLIGAGGTGSACASLLFKMDTVLKKIGSKGLTVTVYDPKRVTPANVGRQAFWGDYDVGHYKSRLLVNRFNQFGDTDWRAETEIFNGKCTNDIDLLITTVDSAKARLEIGDNLSKCRKTKYNADKLWLDLGNSNNRGQALLGSMFGYCSDNKLASPFNLFSKSWLAASQDDKIIAQPSCSTDEAITKQSFGVNDVLASNAFAMLLFPLIRKGEISNHGFIFNLDDCSTDAIPVDENVWLMYGFDPKTRLESNSNETVLQK
ncbi:hypothetical protein UA32_11820 [Photobacterium angustum]|uniref:PRTRC system ThiF family protein n=1 Tax=Photobacterium angustum TaxID=661 RepID=A0ABX5H207_PHOAN|nr:PRTRC system ThiF family protein [Photobacterium angustum]KJG37647.1 hypothetical protein UA32_11820 [Photobacterium angustum]PSX07104.1 PRTRC system ThiF family protein [Photobacterium angustum]